MLCLVSSWFVGFVVWVWGLGGPTQRLGFRIWEAGFRHNGLQSLVVNLGSWLKRMGTRRDEVGLCEMMPDQEFEVRFVRLGPHGCGGLGLRDFLIRVEGLG